MATRTKARPMPVGEFAAAIRADWSARSLAKSTRTCIELTLRIVETTMGVRVAAELERDDAFPRFDAANPHKNPNTRLVHAAAFCALVRRAHALELIRRLPPLPKVGAHRYRRARSERTRSPSPAVFYGFLDRLAVDTSWPGRRTWALTATLGLTGMPLTSATDLLVENVDLAAGVIRAPKRSYRVGPAGRTSIVVPVDVPIHEDLGPILEVWIGCKEPPASPFLFPGIKGGRWHHGVANTASPRDAIRDAAREAGLSISIASLRRFHAENAVASVPTRPKSATSPAAPSHAIRLGEPRRPTYIDGVEVKPLTDSQHAIVRALLAAGRRGLTEGEIRKQTDHGGAPTTLRRLCKRHPQWAEVIRFPGRPHGRIWIDAEMVS